MVVSLSNNYEGYLCQTTKKATCQTTKKAICLKQLRRLPVKQLRRLSVKQLRRLFIIYGLKDGLPPMGPNPC